MHRDLSETTTKNPHFASAMWKGKLSVTYFSSLDSNVTDHSISECVSLYSGCITEITGPKC